MSLLAGVMGQVGCVVVVLIGLALGAGLLLDRLLNTNAIFTVVLMIGSVPVALYVTMRIGLRAAARAQEIIDSNKSEEETKA